MVSDNFRWTHLTENRERELGEWLKLNHIDMTPLEWVKYCLTRLGLVEKEIVTHEKFRRNLRKRGRKKK